MALTSSVISFTNRRDRGICAPAPNYLDSDRTSDCSVQEAIEIAILRHSTIAGRLGGSTCSGAGYIMWVGSIFGGRVVGCTTFRAEISRFEFRIAISLLRKNCFPACVVIAMWSFPHFLAANRAAFRGLGFSRAAPWAEAVPPLNGIVAMLRRRTRADGILRQTPLEPTGDNRGKYRRTVVVLIGNWRRTKLRGMFTPGQFKESEITTHFN